MTSTCTPWTALVPLRFGDDALGDAGFLPTAVGNPQAFGPGRAGLDDWLNAQPEAPRPVAGDRHRPIEDLHPALPVVRDQHLAHRVGVETAAIEVLLRGRAGQDSGVFTWFDVTDASELLISLSGGRHAWLTLSSEGPTARWTPAATDAVDLEGDPLDAAPSIEAETLAALPGWWRHLATGPDGGSGIEGWIRYGHALRTARWPHGPPAPTLSEATRGDLRATVALHADRVHEALDDLFAVDPGEAPTADHAWLAVDLLRELDDLHALATMLTAAGDPSAAETVSEIAERLHGSEADISDHLTALDGPVPDLTRWSSLRASDPTAPWTDLLFRATAAALQRP